ncbi:hypothetical protein [Roseovarius phycicola]|uniref:Lipoprotein n=1 Tax=Roseovarius phycicola TaxID=3080976 RepID=A0ABZ2HK87_9RHOB
MTFLKFIAALPLIGALGACGELGTKADKTVDRGFDSKHLSELKAGIWIDPNGCDHWIIDDGVEGYLSQRLDHDGKPVCSGAGEPNTAVGPFKSGSSVADSV